MDTYIPHGYCIKCGHKIDQKQEDPYIMFFVGILPQDAIITPADDVSEVAYFAPDKIPFDKLAFDNSKRGLNDYIASIG